ncbi:MAG: hypothetical protein J6X33_08095 [Clostridiales bacterium]|nr:hypothetical protein [Clostridiales bacterium]
MTRLIKKHNKKGMGTVEVVIIIAVLVALALIFRESLTNYAGKVIKFCFNEDKVVSALG